jgi:glycosyltransferase involved in cell wall biosynthesis
MQRVLRKGDIFSGCSLPQQHMLVGELAMVGRLKSRTFGYQFSQIVLPGSPAKIKHHNDTNANSFLEKQNIPNESFIILWCGGYNTWTDIETLFTGLVWAMERNEHIHFISVGANTYEGPDNVYRRFIALISDSEYKDRFHLLGWRPWAEIDMYYHVSHLGINIDALHYETIYGTRTRLVEMLAAGLPIITSIGCELSTLIGNYGAGLVFDSGDPLAMGLQILSLSNDDVLYTAMVEKALRMAQNELSFYNTTAPVRAWVNQPSKAPDNISTNFSYIKKDLEYKIRSIIRQLIWKIFSIEK